MIKSNRNSDVLVTKVETVDEYVAIMTVGKERKKTTSKCFLQRNEECFEFRIIRVMLK